jgi:hypothetical protein
MDKTIVWTMLRGLALGAVLLTGLTGCDGIDDDDDEDAGDLSLWITDAPVGDVDELTITITGVEIHPADDEDAIVVEFDRPEQVDLLDLVDEPEMREQLLDDFSLPAGRYSSLRLLLDETRIFLEIDGDTHVPTIPEAEREGLQLPFNVEVDNRTDLDLTIDFDVRKSLRKIDDLTFELHPDLRIVRTEQTGTLLGVVDEELVRRSGCDNGLTNNVGNAVYVFSGAGANFQDLQDNEGDPLATGVVEQVPPGAGDYEFVIGFLPRGSYTAVFTCDGSIDDPEQDNELTMLFSEPVEFDITAGETTEIVFEGF